MDTPTWTRGTVVVIFWSNMRGRKERRRRWVGKALSLNGKKATDKKAVWHFPAGTTFESIAGALNEVLGRRDKAVITFPRKKPLKDGGDMRLHTINF